MRYRSGSFLKAEFFNHTEDAASADGVTGVVKTPHDGVDRGVRLEKRQRMTCRTTSSVRT